MEHEGGRGDGGTADLDAALGALTNVMGLLVALGMCDKTEGKESVNTQQAQTKWKKTRMKIRKINSDKDHHSFWGSQVFFSIVCESAWGGFFLSFVVFWGCFPWCRRGEDVESVQRERG